MAYRKLEGVRILRDDLTDKYPDSYILVKIDTVDRDYGFGYFEGDDGLELAVLRNTLPDEGPFIILRGVNLRPTIGGVYTKW